MLDKFDIEFKKQHPKQAKKRGLVVFLSPLKKDAAGGEGEISEIDAKRLIIYQSNLHHKESFAHEISHVLGLTHTFQEKNSTKNVSIMNEFIKQVDDYLNHMIKSNESQKDISDEWSKHKDKYKKHKETSTLLQKENAGLKYTYNRANYQCNGLFTSNCFW